MSIATDIASLKILTEVYKNKSIEHIIKKTVDCLVEEVPYIHWVGIYYYEQGEKLDENLIASSTGNEHSLASDYNGELKFPIKTSDEKEIGMLVVRTKEIIAFDITDISTLETIANTIGVQTFSN